MKAKWKDLDFNTLKRGDIIRNKGSKNSYVVASNYGNRATAVNTVDVTNKIEWKVLKRK